MSASGCFLGWWTGRVLLTCRRTWLNVIFNSLGKCVSWSHAWLHFPTRGKQSIQILETLRSSWWSSFFIFCDFFFPSVWLENKGDFSWFFFFLIPQRKRGQILIFKNVTIFVRVPCKLQLSKLYYSCVIWVLRKKLKGNGFVLAF